MRVSLAATILACLATAGAAHAQKPLQKFNGAIVSDWCSKLGVGEDLGGYNGWPSSVPIAKECTLACIKAGSKYAINDTNTWRGYWIDNPDAAAPFAGQPVNISGTLDSLGYTLHIVTIETAPLPLKKRIKH